MKLSLSRKRDFQKLRALVGHTPLKPLTSFPVPNRNRILAKEEYKNRLTGSHYDRIYVDLLEDLETSQRIAPTETQLVETSSGNAGTAFAAVARELGYRATVIMPEGIPRLRLARLRELGATIVQTPALEFIRGSVGYLQRLLHGDEPSSTGIDLPFVCPNHSRSHIALRAMARLGEEVITEAPNGIDIFVAAVGNGLSLLGPGILFQEQFGTKVVAWDPLQAPTAYELRHPGRYQSEFGVPPGGLGLHSIFGTGVLGVTFPFLEEAISPADESSSIVEDCFLVADSDALEVLSARVATGELPASVLARARNLPNLNAAHRLMLLAAQEPVGPSSAGSLAVALRLAEVVEEKTLLLICYDSVGNYL